MGCLNDTGQFNHWFGNIHFSGPCNRSCYFCIGQHMMGLDSFNNLDVVPRKMPGLDNFIVQCLERNITEINLTGTNTDPSLYRYPTLLRLFLENKIPNLMLGIRTNGVKAMTMGWNLFDKASFSIPSFNETIYEQIMGSNDVPNIRKIVDYIETLNPDLVANLKANIVLCPENVDSWFAPYDLLKTIAILDEAGITTINLREPYGQPHIGDPLEKWGFKSISRLYGMPQYIIYDSEVTYWDVHYVEVESVNLYANGRVSTDYPITLGYDEKLGKVLDQSNFKKSGRQQEQWLKEKK